jgi:molybdopterin biosynthesis enzyme
MPASPEGIADAGRGLAGDQDAHLFIPLGDRAMVEGIASRAEDHQDAEREHAGIEAAHPQAEVVAAHPAQGQAD